ncbi:MAG: 2-hydroxychromene-2-carboxylate isomerase [Pseudomonadota bacterium]
MSKTLEFYFDFASPNCYLAYKALPDIVGTDADMQIIPCFLGGVFKSTGNQAPMIAFSNVKGKLAYDMLEFQRFLKKHNLSKFQMNPSFPINTLLIMRGLVAAEDQQRKYIDAVLTAMWEEGKNTGDPEAVVSIWNDAGFDAPSLLKRTQDAAVKQKLFENTEAAVARGVFGLPAFFVGDEMFFGKERLGQVAEALIS